MTPDHYAVLGVDEHASLDDIREAWRFAVSVFHPDRFPDEQRGRAEDMAKRVNAAWQVLGDPASRARYDHARGREIRDRQVVRELPCPGCATLSAVPDQGGRVVAVRCPACRAEFDAVVGATLIGRPRLEARYLGGRHLMHLRAADGAITSVAARRLPVELALSEGETVSAVLSGRGRGARYVVVHGRITDLGWRTG